MKKLMIVAAVALAASFAQAAKGSWNSGAVYWTGVGEALSDNTGTALSSTTGYAWLFSGLTLEQYNKLGTDATAIWANFDQANGTLTIDGATITKTDAYRAGSGGKISFRDNTDYSIGPVYAAVIVVHKDANGEIDAYSANTMYGDSTDTALIGVDKTALKWGDGAAQTGANTVWYAVPEPTSGLLLLLGVGALALRRRRA